MIEKSDIPPFRSLLKGDYPNTLTSVKWALQKKDDKDVLIDILSSRNPPGTESKRDGGLEYEILVERFVDRYRNLTTVIWGPGELDRLETSGVLKPLDDIVNVINGDIRELFARAARIESVDKAKVIEKVWKMDGTSELITNIRSQLENLKRLMSQIGSSS
jgi:hypothetical protein